MSEKIEKKVLLLTFLFFCAAMSFMLAYDRYRPLALESGQASEERETQQEKNAETEKGADIPFTEGMEKAGTLVIPVPAGVSSQNVTVENLYREHEIRLGIEGMDEEYLYKSGIAGSLAGIEEYVCERTGSGIVLRLAVDSVYECMVEDGDDGLCFELVKPSEAAERILVLDAGHGGVDDGKEFSNLKEKDFVLTIADAVREKLQEKGVRVYCTREQDEDVTEEERLELVKETQADFCVSLHLAEEPEDSSVYGVNTYYNSTFYIGGFSGGDLAYMVGQALSAQKNVKGLGIFAGEQKYTILRDAGIPAVSVELGYVTNQKELNKLKQDAYREELVTGLCEGILAAYEQKEEME